MANIAMEYCNMVHHFKNVTIILPAINETFSFEQTVQIILDDCRKEDICEFIAVVCKKTTVQSLQSIEKMREMCEKMDFPFIVLWQTRPFAGGAVQDAIDIARGSHLIMMSTDLETDPHVVCSLIDGAKKFPDDITTASRWICDDNFAGYDKKKKFLNYWFQKIFSIFYGVHLTDMTYAFRIFPTDLMQLIVWEEMKHPFYLETALKPIKLGIRFHEIPAKWTARLEGESQNSFLQTFKYLKPAIKIKFYRKRKILKSGERLKHCNLSAIPEKGTKDQALKNRSKMKLCLKFKKQVAELLNTLGVG